MEDVMSQNAPDVVCLCGSARFSELIAATAEGLTREWAIVLTAVFLNAAPLPPR